MRPIHLAQMPGGKTRPVLVLTRDRVRDRLRTVTVAPITSTVREIPTEVRVGPENGLDHDSVVNLDSVVSLDSRSLGRRIGWFLGDQEEELTMAIMTAYDLVELPG